MRPLLATARPSRAVLPHAAPGPAPVGVGFKPEQAEAIAEDAGWTGFFEVHAENYMGAGGPPHRLLTRLRQDHEVSLHGVAMSIGGPGPLCPAHLARFAALVRRYEPFRVSEHLAWSTHGGCFYNDLLPLPYTAATLASVCAHIDQVQSAIGRPLLLENPSTYLVFEDSTMSEPEFLTEVVRRSGCGLLLDVNNLHVSAVNHGLGAPAALDALNALPLAQVGQVHLAGHSLNATEVDGAPLLIDSHDAPVAEVVWALFEALLRRGVQVPTLVEWDSRLPPWPELRREADLARARLQRAFSTPVAEASDA